MYKDSTVENLTNALKYAKAVIRCYQSDIRCEEFPAQRILENGKVTTLDKVGFCQGSIYLETIDRIEKLARGEAKL